MGDIGAHSSTPQRPTVTVCVTCYNQEAYIAQCLESVLSQEFEDSIEILVGDDGSSDGSLEVIEGYARRNPSIVLIRRPQNLGFVANQRDLFRRATGEFVALLEADDFWTDRRKLSRQCAVMRARPDVSLCITSGMQVSEDGVTRIGDMRISEVSRDLGLDDLIREANGRIPTASLLMRRSALEALPEETYDQVIIDYSLQVLLRQQGKVWYDATETCAYRVASHGSWTEGLASSDEKFLRHHESLREYQHFLEGQLGKEWTASLRSAFEPLVLRFYMSSRIGPSDKRRNLPLDLPLLSRRGKIIATMLARVPALSRVGAFGRRRIWGPFLKPLFAR